MSDEDGSYAGQPSGLARGILAAGFNPRIGVSASLLLIASLLSGCSGCSNGNGAATDGGTDTSTTDADTDTDSDTDTDADTDTDTGPPEGFVPDAGPWEWEDLPDAGDCGQDGCRQLTYADEVRVLEWDVWGSVFSYNDSDTRSHVVDFQNNRQVVIPNPFPQYQESSTVGLGTLFPATVYEDTVCYAFSVYMDLSFTTVVCADLTTEIQTLIHSRAQQVGGDAPKPAKYSDLYGNRFVSQGGCGDFDVWTLCSFDISASANDPQVVIPEKYGGYNSLWEDVVVWFTPDTLGDDIRAYDFSTEQFIEITDDPQTQLFPRLHGDRVVYQDLKLGTSNSMGDWNHSAIFMYELSTGETTQITSGDWIAAYPDVHENIIVWADYRDSANPNHKDSLSGVQIWGYNLDTETEFQITNVPDRPKTTPRIWGDKVFVAMYKATTGDAIYMFDLPDGEK